MRFRRHLFTLPRALLAALALSACESNGFGPSDPSAPYDFGYQLQPSGDPTEPLGILLFWSPPANGRAVSYDIYARSSTGQQFARRATTTSPTFHDAGMPQLQYYVQALDGNGYAMGTSEVLTVNLSDRLPAPQGLTSTSLNGAIHLVWSGNAATSSRFDHYRVYSAPYDAANARCSNWAFEGTTVSDAFLSGNLPNGVQRCFAVSAVDFGGLESFWSAVRTDTPRRDARFVLVWASDTKPDSAGFAFLDAGTQQYGRVTSSGRTDVDFRVDDIGGALYLTPVAAGMAVYGSGPVVDLTSVDKAPASGYASTSLSVVPGWAYVFRTQESTGTHYGAVRIAFATAEYVVLDWSYQNGANNPELLRLGEGATIRP